MPDINPITQTTLSVALASPVGTSGRLTSAGSIVTPASMTGVLAPGPNKSNRTILWIDREALEVISITSTTATCHRGVLGTLAVPHVAGTPIWVGTEQDFSSFIDDGNRGGLGLYAQLTVNFETINVTTTAGSSGTTTLTPANLIGGFISATPTGSLNYATPTAALLIAALQSFCNPFIGQSFEFSIQNLAGGAYTITITAGTGATLATSNTMTIAQSNMKRFRVVITNVVAPAYTVYSLGTSVF